MYGEADTQSTTHTYTRVDSPAGLLDLQAVGLQQLSKLSVFECVKDAEARRKSRPKPDNHPKPRPRPKPSSSDDAERDVASIGVLPWGNLCVDEEYA